MSLGVRQDSFCASAAEEFYKTEKTYASQLQCLLKCYLEPCIEVIASKDTKQVNTNLVERLSEFTALVMSVTVPHKILEAKIQMKQEEMRNLLLEGGGVDSASSTTTTTSTSHDSMTESERESIRTSISGTSNRVSDLSSESRIFTFMFPNFPELLLDLASSFKDSYSKYILKYEDNSQLMELVLAQLADVKIFGPAQNRSLEEHTAIIVEEFKSKDQILAQNSGTDLSLNGLLKAPLKRLTNYKLLTGEWIESQKKKGIDVSESTLRSHESIGNIVKSVDRCLMLFRTAERLRTLEEKYKIPLLSSRESEIFVEEHMIRGSRSSTDAKDWKTRPCFVLVCDRTMYIVKLDKYGEEGEPRGDVWEIPLHRVEQIVLKKNAADVSKFLGEDASAIHLKYEILVSGNTAVGSPIAQKIRHSMTTGTERLSDHQDRSLSTTSTLVGETHHHSKEVFLVHEDGLLLQSHNVKIKMAVNQAMSSDVFLRGWWWPNCK